MLSEAGFASQTVPADSILPVTQATERFLMVAPEYWILNFDRSLDENQLQRACAALVQRHSILRSIFVRARKGRFAQIILPEVNTNISRCDTDEPIDDFVDQHRKNDNIPVPTVSTPITHFTFVKSTTGKQALVVRLSHAQFDGYCLHILWNELRDLYEGKPLHLAQDYTLHLKRWWASSQMGQGFEFWKRVLNDATVTAIDNSLFSDLSQAHNPCGGRGSFVTSTKRVELGGNRPNGGYTIATVVKTAWSYTLAQLTGRDDIVFGQYVTGRSNSNASTRDVVGPCLNFMPVRVRLDTCTTGADLMALVQGQHHESLEHELLDCRDIVERSTDWPADTRLQSVLVHQNIDPDLPFAFGDAEAHVTCSYHWEHPPDDILLESRELGNGDIQLTLDTTSRVLTQENADKVVGEWYRWLIALVKNPE
ncbi:hypothetical protein N3K66_001626 [Trichothecium roseum]|uniref:Uncharacterized protein n=1 Tax=Trichothecium roseum TaxID=47278 RepID=A0ACC0VF52_9HYPO|nr:hypothetical protein N3K66_001626 [Trichothecium roseum]